MSNNKKYQWVILVAAALNLILASWFSSGTLAVYGASLGKDAIIGTDSLSLLCGYPSNSDHEQYFGIFKMLAGLPREEWHYLALVRRIGFSFFAYPLMKGFGFLKGGFFASVLFQLICLVSLFFFVNKRNGTRAALITSFLFSTYPGITYWVGLPYANTGIVAASVYCWMAMVLLAEANYLYSALLFAIGFLTYDLYAYFIPAALFLSYRLKIFKKTIPYLTLSLVPFLVVVLYLRNGLGLASLGNPNTVSYKMIVQSYLGPYNWVEWLTSFVEFPGLAVHTFFSSNLFFLPTLFLVCLFYAWRTNRFLLDLSERSIFLGIFSVFLFANLAPPYGHYQLRGFWIPRLVQPLFVVLLVPTAKWIAKENKLILNSFLALTLLLGMAVQYGTAFQSPLSSVVYYQFYRHSTPTSLIEAVRKNGVKPIGFCEKSLF